MHRTRVTVRVLSLVYTHVLSLYSGLDVREAVILHMCLEHGMPVDYRPYAYDTIFDIAVFYEEISRVKLLMRYGADIDHDDGFHLRYAAMTCRANRVCLLIEAGADINVCGPNKPAIAEALTYGTYDIVLQLLQAGATLPDDAMTLARNSAIDSPRKVNCVKRTRRRLHNQ